MPTPGYCASGARAASRLCRACRGGRGDGAWGCWRLPAALCAGGSIVGTGDGRTGVPRIWLATTAVAPVSPCTSGRRVGYGVVAERAGLNCINYVCVCVAGGGKAANTRGLRSLARGTLGGRASVLTSCGVKKKKEPGFVFAQEGPAELNFPPKIFISLIYSNYGAYEHLGGAFANFGSQVGFLCSDCAA